MNEQVRLLKIAAGAYSFRRPNLWCSVRHEGRGFASWRLRVQVRSDDGLWSQPLRYGFDSYADCVRRVSALAQVIS